MEILKGLDICVKNSAVSLGKFDGLHRGHRLLLHEILEKKEFIPTVFTFEMSDIPQKYIYSQEEKNKIHKPIVTIYFFILQIFKRSHSKT